MVALQWIDCTWANIKLRQSSISYAQKNSRFPLEAFYNNLRLTDNQADG